MNHKNTKKAKDSFHPYTNIVSIDPSTICSGVCVNLKLYAVTQHQVAYTKNDRLKRWFESSSSVCDIITYPARIKTDTYSNEEISKLSYYSNISSIIINAIASNISDPRKTIVLLEGYSYSSRAGHLIDLVGVSTLIRLELLNLGYNIRIVAPSELKMMSAKLSYDPINVGKRKPKLEWRNKKGVSGGSFDKHDMFNAILDSKHTTSPWKDFLKSSADDILSMKSIPKPIEDVNDAFLLYKICENDIIYY